MQTNPLITLSVQQLNKAVAIRERIDALEKELGRITRGRTARMKSGVARKKRRLSAAAKARISAAMKARWAKVKKPKGMSPRSAQAAKTLKGISAKTKKPSHRGQLKQRIIRTLQNAGSSGLTVKDLAKKTGKSYGNISVWFHTTAKGVKEIKKLAPGRFAWAA